MNKDSLSNFGYLVIKDDLEDRIKMVKMYKKV